MKIRLLPGGSMWRAGREHERDDPIDEGEGDEHPDQDADRRTNQPLAELLELLEHGDPEVAAVRIRRRKLEGRKPCHQDILTRPAPPAAERVMGIRTAP